nr:LytTR family DNA-binding domain-containing protein [Phenylobacterium sp.]
MGRPFEFKGFDPSKLPRRPAVPLKWGPWPSTCRRLAPYDLRSKLILMRLSDAVSRTGREGLQVHRSWWVAKGAISHVIRDGRNLRLKLLNGLEVPVARRAVIRLKDLDLDAG